MDSQFSNAIYPIDDSKFTKKCDIQAQGNKKSAFSLVEIYRKMDVLGHATNKGKVGNLSQAIRKYLRLKVLATEKRSYE